MVRLRSAYAACMPLPLLLQLLLPAGRLHTYPCPSTATFPHTSHPQVGAARQAAGCGSDGSQVWRTRGRACWCAAAQRNADSL